MSTRNEQLTESAGRTRDMEWQEAVEYVRRYIGVGLPYTARERVLAAFECIVRRAEKDRAALQP